MGASDMIGGRRPVQTTLGGRVALSGIGVHSGRPVSLTMHPAAAGSGISFWRADGINGHVAADFRQVSATNLCTAIGPVGGAVATIEHLMAALSALEVDNALVEIDGPEVPVMDGSAAAFVAAIDEAGVVELAAPRRYLKIVKPVKVRVGDSFAEFAPHRRMRVDITIEFANAMIGRQRFAVDVGPAAFRRELAPARTFGFLADVEALRAQGLALGASVDNVVVVGDDRVINGEGLRFADEFARHKTLDAIGDLALLGAPIIGRYWSLRGGHRLNVAAMAALIDAESAWTYVTAAPRPAQAPAAAPIGIAAFAGEAR